MTADENGITEADYLDIVYRMVNYGVTFETAREAHYTLQMHIRLMDEEKKAGKPRGELVWHAYMVMLSEIIRQRDMLRSKEKGKDFFWLPYTLK